MNALDRLRKMALEDKRRKAPNVPEYALTIPTYSDRTANGLTKCIIDFLRLRGMQAERISCEGRVIDARKTYSDVVGNLKTVGSIKRVRTSAQVGTADISATIRGRSVKIEVKMNDRQSPAQRAYQQQVEAAGGLYVIARTFQGFCDWCHLTFKHHE